jgi:hypothetical protein
MKKLLIFAGTILVIAICVFVASRAYSDWKLRGILFDSFGNVAELKRWEYSTVSYNYFTKKAVVSGLQFFLENGGYLYIGRISGMLEAGDKAYPLSVKDLRYSAGNDNLTVSGITCANGSLAELAAVKWSAINIEPRSFLIGRWASPSFLFNKITVTSLEYKKGSVSIQGESISVEFKRNMGEEIYFVDAENVQVLVSGKTFLPFDNITDIKSFNPDKSTHEEFLTVHSEKLASLSLHCTSSTADNKLKVLRFSYLDRSFLAALSSMYAFIGGSVTQENQWLLTETFSAFISNILGGEIIGKLELMDAILNFFEKPESLVLDIDDEGNTKLSLNGEKPIYIKIESVQEPDIPPLTPQSGETNEFEAAESTGEDGFNGLPIEEPQEELNGEYPVGEPQE